ncbi:hypothetical protein DPMN_177130 [Dreissena polymorpha]|uniref:Transmembrane protein n=1 Tax=Dreissena polymorpha TaxID=45954 RepID=A0A9D4ECG0_DREPO|nr:hypothetical protein DPMN_177130 [Dreissena polymorpha]
MCTRHKLTSIALWPHEPWHAAPFTHTGLRVTGALVVAVGALPFTLVTIATRRAHWQYRIATRSEIRMLEYKPKNELHVQ